MKKVIKFEPMEPLKSNRWILRTHPLNINYHLFNEYKLYYDGNQIVLKTWFMESVDKSYNPQDLLEITDLTIEYLNPEGKTVSGLKMIIDSVNFVRKDSYKKDKIMKTKLKFVVSQIGTINIDNGKKD
jgi:hypothetical protein